jgi:hypothetical protein
MSFVNYVAKLLVPLPNRNVCIWHKADIRWQRWPRCQARLEQRKKRSCTDKPLTKSVATSIKLLPAPTSAANRTRSNVSRSDDDPLATICRRLDALKENPGGRAAGAYCASSTSIKQSRQEVLVDAQRDRQVVHILDVAARRAPTY